LWRGGPNRDEGVILRFTRFEDVLAVQLDDVDNTALAAKRKKVFVFWSNRLDRHLVLLEALL
jgi:hypothetical protein